MTSGGFRIVSDTLVTSVYATADNGSERDTQRCVSLKISVLQQAFVVPWRHPTAPDSGSRRRAAAAAAATWSLPVRD